MTKTSATILVVGLLFCPEVTQGQVRVADEEVEKIETPHPYPAGGKPRRAVWTETLSWPDASFIVVHFDRFELADGDVLVLSDPQGKRSHTCTGRGYREKGGDFWGLSIRGPEMLLTLISSDPDHDSFGVIIDRWTHGYPKGVEDPGIDGLCGADDMKDVECYKNTHPLEYEKARATVRILNLGQTHCTGWLVSCENHILTNEHCLRKQSALDQMEIQFGYERPECGAGTATEELQLAGGTLLEVDEHWDYSLFIPELAGQDPQATYGWLEVATELPVPDELIYLAHHPSGDPKKLSRESDSIHNPSGQCEVFDPGNMVGRGAIDGDASFYCDTKGGSSGGPVISSETSKAVALFHSSAPCPSYGIPLAKILKHLQASDHPLPPCSWCDRVVAASGLSASAAGANSIQLDSTAAADAVEYRVFRTRDGGSGTMGLLATTSSNNYLDSLATGGVTYSYTVRAVNDCVREAEATSCKQASTTGKCLDAPEFVGLTSAVNEELSDCSIRLDWSPGTEHCGTDTRYNVYRSRSPGFIPDSSSLVASCVDTASWIDRDPGDGLTYHYIIRAEDDSGNGTGRCSGGNEDRNLIRRSSTATGSSQGRHVQAADLRKIVDGISWQLCRDG